MILALRSIGVTLSRFRDHLSFADDLRNFEGFILIENGHAIAVRRYKTSYVIMNTLKTEPKYIDHRGIVERFKESILYGERTPPHRVAVITMRSLPEPSSIRPMINRPQQEIATLINTYVTRETMQEVVNLVNVILGEHLHKNRFIMNYCIHNELLRNSSL